MNFKRFSASDNQWHDVPYYIHKTDTDTITTLPAVIYANDTTATVGLKGNTVQNGTPTPTTPIQPQECGEMTRNLANLYGVDKTALSLNFKTGDNMTIAINGTKGSGANVISIAYPNITLPAGTYTVRIKMIGGTISNITGGAIFGINASTYSMRTTPQISKVGDIGIRTFTLTEDTLLSSLDITPSYGDVGSVWDNATFECWLYSGSDDIPYENFGYKIPISSANTTTPVYLGEVQSTRKVKKLEFDGTENWVHRSGNPPNAFFLEINTINVVNNLAISTHYINQDSGSFVDLQDGHILVRLASSGDKTYIGLRDSNYPATSQGRDQLKEWLAQQYANGTPVCVWYVLANETTGVVNEPLRKIGDYADEVSGITIPTITGADSFDVLTTLKPSEVSLTYTGWHDAEVKEWDDSEWEGE